jgi:SAM-dependent methyltransferase
VTLPPLSLGGWLRYDLIERMLSKTHGIQSVLEIGTGVGAISVRLARRFRYVGLELDRQSYEISKERLQRAGRGIVLHGDLSTLDGSARFDLVCAFEVLEHIENDWAALLEWRDRIRAEGWILLTVPAFQRLWGPWDELAGHYRRYERDQIRDLLASTGFVNPVIWTSGFPLGHLLEWARNSFASRQKLEPSKSKRTQAIGHVLQPPDYLGWLTRWVSAPFRLLQRPFVATEFGRGLVVLARRSG